MSSLQVWIMRASILSIAPAVEFGSRFGRNIVLSRLLAPHEFGTAVAITVVAGTAALVTDVGFDKFVIVRSDEEEALAAAHLLSIVRGLLVSIVLVLAAPMIAATFGVREFASSFALAGAILFLRSFAHMGIKQVQKRHKYGPESIALLLSHLAAFVLVIPAAYVFKDHRAIIASFFVESAAYVIASHMLAETAYRFRVGRAIIYGALSFGLPLTLNGIGLATTAQLDRILIGHWFGVDTLALYALILSLSIVPVSLLFRVFGTMGLSYLAAGRLEQKIVAARYASLVLLFGLMSAGYALFIAISLDEFVPLIYGPRFAVNAPVHVLMTAIVFFGFQTGAPTILLLATGGTRVLAILNLSGGIGLALAAALMQVWPSFETMLFCVLFGGIIKFVLFVVVSSRKMTAVHGAWVDSVVAFLVASFVVVLLASTPEPTLKERETLLIWGTLAIAVQAMLGFRRNKLLPNALGNKDPG